MEFIQTTARRLGVVGTIIATAVAAVIVNLIIYAIGSVAGGSYDFTNNGDVLRVEAITLVGFTAMPVLLGLTLTAAFSRYWSWVYPVGMAIGFIAAVGTIFIMTIPADLDTASTVALAAAHVVVGFAVVAGVLGLRALRPKRSFGYA